MPSSFARVVTTAIIWFGVTMLAGVMSPRVNGGDAVFMVVVVALAAAWATRSVWSAGMTVIQQQAQADEKSKRSGSPRVRKFVEGLSENELDELRERLAVHNEEPVSLQSLLPRRMRND